MIGNPILEEDEEIVYEAHLNGMENKLQKIFEEIKLNCGKSKVSY